MRVNRAFAMPLEEKKATDVISEFVKLVEAASAAVVEQPDVKPATIIAADCDTVGGYELLEKLGESVQASLYKSKMPATGKPILLKLYKQDWRNNPVAAKRFAQEAEDASQVTHPNLVSLYDWGITEAGHPFVVTDLVEGIALSELLKKEGFLDPEHATEVARQCCEALQQIHAANLLHGNIKSENIFLCFENSSTLVKVSDFAFSALQEDSDDASGSGSKTGETGDATYMSPERCMGYKLDSRSDIYSFGVVFYQILSGRVPFSDDKEISTVVKHLNFAPPPFASVGMKVPRALEQIVFRCLEKNRSARYQVVSELLADLEIASAQVAFEEVSPTVANPADKKVAADARRAKRKKIRRRLLRAVAIAAGVFLVFGIASGVNGRYKRNKFPRQYISLDGRVYDPSTLSYKRLRDLGERAYQQGRVLTACDLWLDAAEKAEATNVRQSRVAHIYGRLGTAFLALDGAAKPNEPVVALANQSTEPMLLAVQRKTMPGAPEFGTASGTVAAFAQSADIFRRHDISPTGYLKLADQYLQTAVDKYQSAGKLTPEQKELMSGLADAKFGLGNYAESEKIRRKTLELVGKTGDIEFVAWQQANLGATLARLGKTAEAEKYLRRSLNELPAGGVRAEHAYVALESVLQSQNRLADAEKLIKDHMNKIESQWGQSSYPFIADEFLLSKILTGEQRDLFELRASRHLRQRFNEPRTVP